MWRSQHKDDPNCVERCCKCGSYFLFRRTVIPRRHTVVKQPRWGHPWCHCRTPTTSPMLVFLTASSFQPRWSLSLGGLGFAHFIAYFPSKFCWLSLLWNFANPHQLVEQVVCVLWWTCDLSRVSSCLWIYDYLF